MFKRMFLGSDDSFFRSALLGTRNKKADFWRRQTWRV